MPVTQKHTSRKNSGTIKITKTKKFDDNGIVFFPEKLAKANALLDKAFLDGVELTPKTKKETKGNKVTRKPKKQVSNKVKDYGNDPFFVEKAKKSKQSLEKNGFPKELLAKK